MDLSAELVARILCFIPLSPAKLAMQGVSKTFRRAMQTTQAHAGTTEVTFPLQASHSPCISKDILRVLSFVCLGPNQNDFSRVAFLDHLQSLACEYGALQPVSSLQTVQELTLECIMSYGRTTYFSSTSHKRFLYDKKISLAHMFPNVKRLYLHSIPQGDIVDGEACFLQDIQLLSLQRVVLDNYPDKCMPLLAQNPHWELLEVSVNPMPFGNQMPLTESCVHISTALLVTTLNLQDIDTDRLDLSEFCCCSRLKTLTFRLWRHADFFQTFRVSKLATLPKSCCTVKFLNFEPWLHLSELTGWRRRWDRSKGPLLKDLELTRVE